MRRRNSDGGIWRLNWERTPDGFRAWVKVHPSVSVTAPTWEEIELAISDAVGEHLQAGEWTADWDPPPPDPAGTPWSTVERYLMLAGQARFAIFNDPEEVFTGGICKVCGQFTGSRSDAPLRVYVEEAAGIAFSCWSCPGSLNVLAEEFVALLTPGQRRGVEFREVRRLGRGRKVYVEPIPDPETIIAYVGLKGHEPQGWRCDECGYQTVAYYVRGWHAHRFLAAEQVPACAESFWVGAASAPNLCVTREWWHGVARAKGCRGVVTSAVAAASADRANPRPVLRAPERPGCRDARHWRQTQKRLAEAWGLKLPAGESPPAG